MVTESLIPGQLRAGVDDDADARLGKLSASITTVAVTIAALHHARTVCAHSPLVITSWSLSFDAIVTLRDLLGKRIACLGASAGDARSAVAAAISPFSP